MKEIRIVLFGIIVIFMLLLLLLYILDYTEILEFKSWWPVSKDESSYLVVQDDDYPTEIEKLGFAKEKEKLLEYKETLSKRENVLKKRELQVERREQKISEIKRGIQAERKRIAVLTKDWHDRKKKINDLATKVISMPPEKAVEMMRYWKHFDIIDVIRAIDQISLEEGRPSITPYLLTLFTVEERSSITRKMMLPPLLSGNTLVKSNRQLQSKKH